jgi:hypothetical protein
MATHASASGSHKRIVLSSDPDASRCPVGENATDLTAPVCSVRVPTHCPLSGFQSMTVLSHDPDASRCPNGENATEYTASV